MVIIKNMEKKDIIRQVYEVLPKLNCGFCGFGNCGQFAKAVAEGKASLFGCQQNPWSGYRISQIISVKVPAYRYRFRPAYVPGAVASPSTKTLKAESRALSRKMDEILVRIERLRQR